MGSVGFVLGIGMAQRVVECYRHDQRALTPHHPIYPYQIDLYKYALKVSPNHENALENLKEDEQYFADLGQRIPGDPLGFPTPTPRSPKAPPELPTLYSRQSSPSRGIPIGRVKKVSALRARVRGRRYRGCARAARFR